MKFIKRRREVIFDEADLEIVMKTLAQTTRQCCDSNYRWFRGSVGSCGWAKEPEKWFAHFSASKEDYHAFIDKMKQMGITLYSQDTSTKPWKTIPMY